MGGPAAGGALGPELPDLIILEVNAVVYYRVLDPARAVVEVENYMYATSQLAQTTLRSVVGQTELDALLSERDEINDKLQRIIDWPSWPRPSLTGWRLGRCAASRGSTPGRRC